MPIFEKNIVTEEGSKIIRYEREKFYVMKNIEKSNVFAFCDVQFVDNFLSK
jgi:hypothetical protein